MFGSVNKVILVGNVGKDPKITEKNDKTFASFSLATTSRHRNMNGEWEDITEWHNISVLNNKIATIVSRFVKSGTKLFVEGNLKNEKYVDKEGMNRNITKIIVGFDGCISIISKVRSGTDNYTPPSMKNDNYSSPRDNYSSPSDIIDDEIPF